MAKGWPLIHPDLRSLLTDLDHWSQAQRIRRPVITDLIRSGAKQKLIYLNFWTELAAELVTKGVIDSGPADRTKQMRNEAVKLLVKQRALPDAIPLILSGVPLKPETRVSLAHCLRPETLEEYARLRFTWHFCNCAADLRTRHYAQTEKARAFAWLEARCIPRHAWELLEHDTAGPHFHVARKDEEWKRRYAPEFIKGESPNV